MSAKKSQLVGNKTFIELISSWIFFLLSVSTCFGFQEPIVKNGDFEQFDQEKGATSWRLMNPKISQWSFSTESPNKNSKSLQITAKSIPQGQFSGINQTIDGKALQGKKLELKAFSKVEQGSSAAVQLWIRVDRETGKSGAFDNMQDRPIKRTTWGADTITIQVDADAKSISFGAIVTGDGIVWIDDFSITESEGSSNPTSTRQSSSQGKKSDGGGVQFITVQEARKTDHLAPQQPFFTPWLLIPIGVIICFAVAQIPASPESETLPEKSESGNWLDSFWVKAAFRFSFCYWILFCFPRPLANISPWGVNYLYIAKGWIDHYVVTFFADYLFQLDGPLVMTFGNGSGDTTFSYLQVLGVISTSLFFAILWSAVDRRNTRYEIAREFLTVFVRYCLALTMLNYGLAKVAWDVNQFSYLSEYQIESQWADNSPMGVLWRTMGYSRSYSVFGGAGEVLAALLLLFRRTTLAGAFVTIGVMTNVVMMNLCYDVPVKLYSTHYLVMAFFLVLPHTLRMTNIFLLNRPVSEEKQSPGDQVLWWLWTRRILKWAVVIYAFAVPIFSHSFRQYRYFTGPLISYEGRYNVNNLTAIEEIPKDLQSKLAKIDSLPEPYQWKWVAFKKWYSRNGTLPSTMIAKTAKKQVLSRELVDDDPSKLKLKSPFPSTSIPSSSNNGKDQKNAGEKKPEEGVSLFALEPISGLDHYILNFQFEGKEYKLLLSPVRYKLTDRGFRWINETPFNR